MPSLLTTLAIAATALIPLTTAICNDGEMALGVSQLCFTYGGQHTGCGDATGALWGSDCSDIASTTEKGFCNGGFTNGVAITCDNNGWPDAIYHGDDVYGYCYDPGNGGQACDAQFDGYTSVWYCCGKEN